MSTTIAVAIITALATIAGGATAGIISLIAQDRQAERQQKDQRRQTCRDAYVNLLTSFDEAMAAVDLIWMEPTPSDKAISVLDSLRNPVNHETRLAIAVNTVYLEGPEGVRNAARELIDVFNGETRIVYRCAQENVGKAGYLYDFIEAEKIGSERGTKKRQFIVAAAKALGIDFTWS